MTDEHRLAEQLIADWARKEWSLGTEALHIKTRESLVDKLATALRAAHGAGMQKAAEIATDLGIIHPMGHRVAAAILEKKDQAS